MERVNLLVKNELSVSRPYIATSWRLKRHCRNCPFAARLCEHEAGNEGFWNALMIHAFVSIGMCQASSLNVSITAKYGSPPLTRCALSIMYYVVK